MKRRRESKQRPSPLSPTAHDTVVVSARGASLSPHSANSSSSEHSDRDSDVWWRVYLSRLLGQRRATRDSSASPVGGPPNLPRDRSASDDGPRSVGCGGSTVCCGPQAPEPQATARPSKPLPTGKHSTVHNHSNQQVFDDASDSVWGRHESSPGVVVCRAGSSQSLPGGDQHLDASPRHRRRLGTALTMWCCLWVWWFVCELGRLLTLMLSSAMNVVASQRRGRRWRMAAVEDGGAVECDGGSLLVPLPADVAASSASMVRLRNGNVDGGDVDASIDGNRMQVGAAAGHRTMRPQRPRDEEDGLGHGQETGAKEAVARWSFFRKATRPKALLPTIESKGSHDVDCGDEQEEDSHAALTEQHYYYDVEEGSMQPRLRLMFRQSLSRGVASVDNNSNPSVGTASLRSNGTTVTGSSNSRTAASVLLMPSGGCDGGNAGAGIGESLSRSPKVPMLDVAAEFCIPSLLPPASSSSNPSVLASQGYFVGACGDIVGNGAFQLIACIGQGTFSSVWLAVDVRGVTATTLPNMLHRLEHATSYNGSASILSGSLAHSFVVLKISRHWPEFVHACEVEFQTNRMLLLELQRRGFALDRFLLYPTSFTLCGHQSPMAAHRSTILSSPSRASSATVAPVSPPSHIAQVGEVCGPSLLFMIETAHPKAFSCDEFVHAEWRLSCVRELVTQVLEGLAQLHQCAVVHSDLKPENILFTLPAAEYLEHMLLHDRLRSKDVGSDDRCYPSAAQTVRQTREFLLAKHRAEIICRAHAWRTIIRGESSNAAAARNSHVVENSDLFGASFDDADAVRRVCSVKIADLGSSIRVAAALRPASSGTSLSSSSSRSSSFAVKQQQVGGTSSGSDTLAFPAPPFPAGVSSLPPPTWTPRVIQTREYRSPEVLLQLHPSMMLTPALDVWSFGCLLFELVTGHYLFHPRLFFQQLQHAQSHPDGAASNTQTAVIHAEDEAAIDRLHLHMIAEVVGPMPQELHSHSLYLRRTRGSEPQEASVNFETASAAQSSQTRQRHILELLHRALGRDPPPSSMNDMDSARQAVDLSEIADVIAACLEWQPHQRPTCAELLQRAWFRRPAVWDSSPL